MFSKHRYATQRELGVAPQAVRRNYYQRLFQALFPSEYHAVKRKCGSENDWFANIEKKENGYLKNMPQLNSNFHKAVLCGDENTCLQILAAVNEYNLQALVATIAVDFDEDVDFSDFWTSLNPMSPYRPNASVTIRDAVWKFVVRCTDDTEILFKLAVYTHQPLTVFADLLARFADVDINAILTLVLLRATELNQTEVVKLLLPQIVSDENVFYEYDQRPLHLACQVGNLELVQLFIQHDDINQVNALGETPLHLACVTDDPRIVKLLLENKANVHGQRMTELFEVYVPPIIIACRSGNSEMVKLLLAYGAYLHETDYTQESAGEDDDSDFQFPLYEAVRNDHFTLAEELIALGANVNQVKANRGISSARAEERTTLHDVCKNHNYAQAKFLLRHGADINACSDDYVTPVHMACSGSPNLEFIAYLLHSTPANFLFEDITDTCALEYLKLNLPEDKNTKANLIFILEHHLLNFNVIFKDVDLQDFLYHEIIQPLCAELPDLLLCYAVITRQDLDEIKRIIATGATMYAVNRYGHTAYALAERFHPEVKEHYSLFTLTPTASVVDFSLFNDDSDLLDWNASVDNNSNKRRSRSASPGNSSE